MLLKVNEGAIAGAGEASRLLGQGAAVAGESSLAAAKAAAERAAKAASAAASAASSAVAAGQLNKEDAAKIISFATEKARVAAENAKALSTATANATGQGLSAMGSSMRNARSTSTGADFDAELGRYTDPSIGVLGIDTDTKKLGTEDMEGADRRQFQSRYVHCQERFGAAGKQCDDCARGWGSFCMQVFPFLFASPCPKPRMHNNSQFEHRNSNVSA